MVSGNDEQGPVNFKVTKSIFISHANEDKPTIQPFVQALHKEMTDYSLFIDRPAEIGINPSDGRVEFIDVGTSWRDKLKVALDTDGLVLFFATPTSVDKLLVDQNASGACMILLDEFFVARFRKRIIVVVLGKTPEGSKELVARIPQGLHEDQWIDLSQSIPTALGQCPYFGTLKQSLRNFNRSPDEDPVSRLELLPKLINREETMLCAIQSGIGTVRKAAGLADAQTTGMIVLCENDDVPEMIGERFSEFDGRDSFLGLQDDTHNYFNWMANETWKLRNIHTKNVNPEIKPGTDKETVSRTLKTALEQLFDENHPLNENYPMLVTANFDLSGNEKGLPILVTSWAEVWADLFDDLAGRQHVPVFPLLCIQYKAPSRWQFWRDHPYGRFKSETKQAIRNARSSANLLLEIGPQLDSVKRIDIQTWKSSRRVNKQLGSGYEELDLILKSLFSKGSGNQGVPMRPLQDEVQRVFLNSGPNNGALQ